MVKRISIYICFLIFAQTITAQDLRLGEDFVLVVRLVTNQNKADYINKQLEREDLSAKTRTSYQETLKTLESIRDKQEAYIAAAFRNGFKNGHVYFVYDHQLKNWDKLAPLELKGLDGGTVTWNDSFKMPFMMLASGDYTVTHLTEQSLIILNTDFDRAAYPLGMFKSIKVRGESLFTFSKLDQQWMKSINYLKEHLWEILSNPESVEGIRSNLLFDVDAEVKN